MLFAHLRARAREDGIAAAARHARTNPGLCTKGQEETVYVLAHTASMNRGGAYDDERDDDECANRCASIDWLDHVRVETGDAARLVDHLLSMYEHRPVPADPDCDFVTDDDEDDFIATLADLARCLPLLTDEALAAVTTHCTNGNSQERGLLRRIRVLQGADRTHAARATALVQPRACAAAASAVQPQAAPQNAPAAAQSHTRDEQDEAEEEEEEEAAYRPSRSQTRRRQQRQREALRLRVLPYQQGLVACQVEIDRVCATLADVSGRIKRLLAQTDAIESDAKRRRR